MKEFIAIVLAFFCLLLTGVFMGLLENYPEWVIVMSGCISMCVLFSISAFILALLCRNDWKVLSK